MRRLLAAMLAAAALGGCSSSAVSKGLDSAKIYPATGQFPDQQERDSHDCKQWALQQNFKSSGFVGGLQVFGGAATGAGTERYGYNQDGLDRAFTQCMNSRGYAVYW